MRSRTEITSTSAMPRATRTLWRRPWSLPPHRHPEPRVVVVLRGTIDERCGRASRACRAGTVIYRPADEMHSDTFTSPAGAYVSVAMPDLWLERTASCEFRPADSQTVRSGRAVAIAQAIGAELAAADPWSQLSLQGLTLELLAELARERSSARGARPRWLETVCDVVREHPERSWSLAQLAAIAGVHPSHLIRTFRSHVRMSVGDFLRLERAEAARRLMERTTLSFADISVATGFCDQAHLARVFRRYFGLTPSAYRRAVRSS
jgi:AraC family transcriptional regulator